MSNNEMKHLFIEPLDVWLFRNGRPFNSQEDHTAQGTFPPFPSTMQGILRTHHLALHGINIYDQTAVTGHVGTRYSYPDNF
jgi:CRISPR-associated protein Cmr3